MPLWGTRSTREQAKPTSGRIPFTSLHLHWQHLVAIDAEVACRSAMEIRIQGETRRVRGSCRGDDLGLLLTGPYI